MRHNFWMNFSCLVLNHTGVDTFRWTARNEKRQQNKSISFMDCRCAGSVNISISGFSRISGSEPCRNFFLFWSRRDFASWEPFGSQGWSPLRWWSGYFSPAWYDPNDGKGLPSLTCILKLLSRSARANSSLLRESLSPCQVSIIFNPLLIAR